MPPWYCMSLFWERAGWLLSNVFVPEPWRGIQSRGTFNRSVYLNTFFSFSVLMMGEFTVFITGKKNMQHWMFVELGLALHSLAYLLAFFWQADAFKGRKKQKTQKSTHVWYAVTFFLSSARWHCKENWMCHLVHQRRATHKSSLRTVSLLSVAVRKEDRLFMADRRSVCVCVFPGVSLRLNKMTNKIPRKRPIPYSHSQDKQPTLPVICTHTGGEKAPHCPQGR